MARVCFKIYVTNGLVPTIALILCELMLQRSFHSGIVCIMHFLYVFTYTVYINVQRVAFNNIEQDTCFYIPVPEKNV